jgi:hypothetical protein
MAAAKLYAFIILFLILSISIPCIECQDSQPKPGILSRLSSGLQSAKNVIQSAKDTVSKAVDTATDKIGDITAPLGLNPFGSLKQNERIINYHDRKADNQADHQTTRIGQEQTRINQDQTRLDGFSDHLSTRRGGTTNPSSSNNDQSVPGAKPGGKPRKPTPNNRRQPQPTEGGNDQTNPDQTDQQPEPQTPTTPQPRPQPQPQPQPEPQQPSYPQPRPDISPIRHTTETAPRYYAQPLPQQLTPQLNPTTPYTNNQVWQQNYYGIPRSNPSYFPQQAQFMPNTNNFTPGVNILQQFGQPSSRVRAAPYNGVNPYGFSSNYPNRGYQAELSAHTRPVTQPTNNQQTKQKSISNKGVGSSSRKNSHVTVSVNVNVSSKMKKLRSLIKKRH